MTYTLPTVYEIRDVGMKGHINLIFLISEPKLINLSWLAHETHGFHATFLNSRVLKKSEVN